MQGWLCADVVREVVRRVVRVVRRRLCSCCAHGFVRRGCEQDDGHSPAAQPQEDCALRAAQPGAQLNLRIPAQHNVCTTSRICV